MDIDLLPCEIIYSILLPLPYSSIRNFCLANQLLTDTHFWATKCHYTISKVIIINNDLLKIPFPYQEFYQTQLSPSQHYLQLLTVEAKECQRGSEQFVDVNQCVILAAYRNNLSLVKYFINKGASLLKLVAYYAALNNNRSMIDYVLTSLTQQSRLAVDIFKELLRGSAIIGDKDLINYLIIDKDLINYLIIDDLLDNHFILEALEQCLPYVCENGHLQLLDDLRTINIKYPIYYDWNKLLLVAAYSGNIKIMDKYKLVKIGLPF